ncbi:hypothetical protein [Winogradskyella sp.]|uniref:hypothetical protein n=1 Tax=Winogradskyella sp. TaxID=1883156 RepID=UPI003BA97BD2
MLKNFTIPVFMFLMLASYGQKSTLLQNVNFRAKDLKHGLNEIGDSLILTSEKTIYSVEIFNQDFEKVVDVAANETKIPLNDTPLGRLVVQAKMQNKRIIMTLLRHEEIEIISEEQLESDPISNTVIPERDMRYADVISKTNPRIIEHDVALNAKNESIFVMVVQTPVKHEIEKPIVRNEELPRSDMKSRRSLSSMLNWKPKKANTSSKVFWISYLVNSGTNSAKSMRMVSHSEADELISRYKLENKTQQGKLNKLTIWEVYDANNFIKKQSENRDYVHSSESDLFDVIPYFTSEAPSKLY